MNFNIDKVVDGIIEMSDLMGVDYMTVWKKYTHELITKQFTWEEIEKQIKRKRNDDKREKNKMREIFK